MWGVDLVEEHLMACAGIPVRPPVARRPLKQMAEYSINAKVRGWYTPLCSLLSTSGTLTWHVELSSANITLALTPPCLNLTPALSLPLTPSHSQVTGILKHVDYLKAWQGHPEVCGSRPVHLSVCPQHYGGLPSLLYPDQWLCPYFLHA